MANFFVKFVSKMLHMHLDQWIDAMLDLGELKHCVLSILVSTL